MSLTKNKENSIYVTSEIGTLKRLMIHSPDSGLGKVVPSKAQDWLFEDIIHLDTMRREEYDYYIKLLLYFLDTDKIKGKLQEIDSPATHRNFYKPDDKAYFNSDKVIDPQFLLSQILENQEIKIKLVSSICAVERCSYKMQQTLLAESPVELAKTLISGALPNGKMVFPPVPNFIFTRDIGIVIKDHILLNRPAKLVRIRESLIMKYIFHNHPYFAGYQDKIIEVSEEEHQFFVSDEDKFLNEVTVEGGDVMTVSAEQVVIGCSERTSLTAINQIIHLLFEKDIVKKVSVVKIPAKRDFMHIDTIFTQVKRNVWVLFGALSRQNQAFQSKDFIKPFIDKSLAYKPYILQFEKGKAEPRKFEYLEDLCDSISREDLGSQEPTQFIYSGGNEFPFELREQWTDSCNVLAVKEGVVIGYDRNTKTAEEFKRYGFEVLEAEELIRRFEQNETTPATIKDTLILLPSAELSRARGGSHCMSMPLLREDV
ncbi:MAG: arginine deiminase family protein [Microscillaceae bacterium]|nr:arginine deiminase family protein [Microscillaceae bacterium]